MEKRLLSRKEAAAYVGLSPNAFDKAVSLGHYPAPNRLTGIDRVQWDRVSLDSVINRRFGIKGAPADDFEARRAEAARLRQGSSAAAR